MSSTTPLRPLMAVLLLAFGGTLADLWLIEHLEDPLQWIPVGVLFAAFLTTVWVLGRPGKASARGMMLAMAACVVAGAVGVFLHLRGNLEFEQEMRPTVPASALIGEALRGATLALAPGSLVPLGLFGWIIARRVAVHSAASTGAAKEAS